MSHATAADRVHDDELLGRVGRGDRSAFAELFRRRHRDVFRFAVHMTDSPAVAEDVVQDTFMIVMKDASRYEAGRSSPTAWLCGIARNLVRRTRAAEWRIEPVDDASIGDGPAPAPAGGDPLDSLLRAERVDTLRRAVVDLPVQFREAVVLCDLQELSYEEAAEAMDCAVGTVRSRLHRGRALLSARLTAAGRPLDSAAGGTTTKRELRAGRCLA